MNQRTVVAKSRTFPKCENFVKAMDSITLTLLCSYPIISITSICLYFAMKRFKAYHGFGRESVLSSDDYAIFNKNNNNFLIIGSQACGKSSLAKQIKSIQPRLELIELDMFCWKENWKKNNKFNSLLKDALFDEIDSERIPKYEGVIMDGNFNRIKQITWNLADVVIWLDYDFCEVLYRAIKRTIIRIITAQKVCNGNVETLRRLIYDFEATVIYKVWKYHKQMNEEIIPNDYIKLFPNKHIVRLKSPYECKQWLKSLVLR